MQHLLYVIFFFPSDSDNDQDVQHNLQKVLWHVISLQRFKWQICNIYLFYMTLCAKMFLQCMGF